MNASHLPPETPLETWIGRELAALLASMPNGWDTGPLGRATPSKAKRDAWSWSREGVLRWLIRPDVHDLENSYSLRVLLETRALFVTHSSSTGGVLSLPRRMIRVGSLIPFLALADPELQAYLREEDTEERAVAQLLRNAALPLRTTLQELLVMHRPDFDSLT